MSEPHEILIWLNGSEIINTPVLDNVGLVKGCYDPLDQPVPATFRFATFGMPETAVGIYDLPSLMYAQIHATIDNNSFDGYVTNINVVPVDALGTTQIVEFTCTHISIDLASSIIGLDEFPAETEADRVARVVAQSSSLAWEYLPSDMPWNDLGAGGFFNDSTWANFAATPGTTVYTLSTGSNLEARLPGATDSLSYLQELARSTSGFFRNCDTYYSRLDLVAAEYTEFNVAPFALTAGLESNLDLSNIYNAITYTNSTLSQYATDGDSISRYGVRALEMQSPLADTADLLTLAQIKSGILGQVRQQLMGLTLNLDEMSWVQRGELASLDFFHFAGLPAQYGSEGDYMIRGRNIIASKEHIEMQLVLLSRNYYDPSTEWKNVSATDTWNTYLLSTTTWSEVL